MIFFYKLKKFFKKLFVRATISALIALFSAFASYYWGYAIPDDLVDQLGTKSVDTILQIIASNMLVIVTFSLATMVAGYTSASQGVTPRAARILIENQKSENAISIFLGAFIFSIVSLVALSTELYGRDGRFILFVFTCLIIFMIVWTIIRWIEELSKLGRVHETILKIEKSACIAFHKNGKNPNRYCNTYLESPKLVLSIKSNEVGYVQSIDFEKLNKFSHKIKSEIFIKANPGFFVHKNSSIVDIKIEDIVLDQKKVTEEVNDFFVIDNDRSIENDPRYNLTILSEVASRALSSGVNDPGTAIDALRSATKVFHHWISVRKNREREIKYSRLFVQEITLEEFFDDFFRPISRDSAEFIEVLVRLLEALQSMTSGDSDDPSLLTISNKYKKNVLFRGLQCLRFDDDKELLRKTYDELIHN